MRTERTIEELQRLSHDLREAAEVIEGVTEDMQSRKVASISIHGAVQFSRDVPSLLAWSYKVAAEWKTLSFRRNGHSREEKKDGYFGTDAGGGERDSPTTQA